MQSEWPGVIAAGPWFQWHFDAFGLPPGARLAAHNRLGPQAFLHGRSLGLQFHPEADLEIVAGWAAAAPHELDAHGVDADQLLERTSELAEDAREVSLRLLEGYYDMLFS